MAGFNLIYCVVNDGDADRTMEIARKYGVTGGTISVSRGTVQSRILEILGLDEVRKEVISMVVPHELASAAIKGISAEMNFDKPNHGVACSLPVLEFIGVDTENKIKKSEVKIMYKAIFVIVDKGKADEVVEAAKSAGAKGATIINGRGAGIHEAQKFFNIKIVPEKEEVFIIAKKELKDGIVNAVRENLKIEEPGNGILFVMDIEEVYGLPEN